MNYRDDMLNRLLDSFERRRSPSHRPLTLNIAKTYPDYTDSFSSQQGQIDAAVAQLETWGLVHALKDSHGYYVKLTMDSDQCKEAYKLLKREPKASLIAAQREVVASAQDRLSKFFPQLCQDLLLLLDNGKFPEYNIGKDTRKLRDVLLALEKIGQLTTETYVRNFSEAIFHDSKRFQEIQGSVEHILLQYNDNILDDKTVLEQYNLYQNPSYVYIKGCLTLYAGENVYDIAALPGGIALPATALPSISDIRLSCGRVVSVENLTTYHDTDECDSVVLYLGGFPNSVRIQFLMRLYQSAPDAHYFHRGDLDPYGFLILENLKEKTQIPFQPLEMDLATLEHCFHHGHYRPLDAQDLKAISLPQLSKYQEIFAFMQLHNCKIEQECFEAMKLDLL